MSTLKPCPFCAAELRIRAGFNSYGHCPTDGCYANRGKIVPLDDERQVAAWNRRPALSLESLAGGAINWLMGQRRIQASASVRNGNATVNHEEIVGFIDLAIAALSPEAPAREGGDLEGLLTTALTDELQDGGAEVPYSIIAERVAARVADEASAPSCAEEALGNLLAVIHGDGGHRALEVGTKQAALEAEKIVADLLSSAPEAPACTTCGGKGYTEHEGGDGEGYPSRPEIDDCPRCHKAPAEGAGEDFYAVGEFVGRQPVLCVHGSTDPNNLCPYCEGEKIWGGRNYRARSSAPEA